MGGMGRTGRMGGMGRTGRMGRTDGAHVDGQDARRPERDE
jgi:hypothetical protein